MRSMGAATIHSNCIYFTIVYCWCRIVGRILEVSDTRRCVASNRVNRSIGFYASRGVDWFDSTMFGKRILHQLKKHL